MDHSNRGYRAPQQQQRTRNAETIRGLVKLAMEKRSAAQLELLTPFLRVEQAYDACNLLGLAIAEASFMKIDAERGHHTETLRFMFEKLRLNENLCKEVRTLQYLRSSKYEGGVEVTIAQATHATKVLDRIFAEVELWFQNCKL